MQMQGINSLAITCLFMGELTMANPLHMVKLYDSSP